MTQPEIGNSLDESTFSRVPFDPELLQAYEWFKSVVECEPLTASTIASYRERRNGPALTPAQIAGNRNVQVEHLEVPGPPGAPPVGITMVSPIQPVSNAPAIYAIHGGGMVIGRRYLTAIELARWAEEFGVIGFSVDYRLAPEHPDPAPVEDCYAGLHWLATNADTLGVDPNKILVMGGSAGGGLAAGIALLARDRGFPALAGQCLVCPMIDDRNDTLSALQHREVGVWPGTSNETGWNALLGSNRRGGPHVSPYAAPARMEDLSGLPPAYIEVGSAEVFRDESVDYAMRIWAVGGRAELTVWDGGFHGFNGAAPEARISRAANAAREAWIRRVLDIAEPAAV